MPGASKSSPLAFASTARINRPLAAVVSFAQTCIIPEISKISPPVEPTFNGAAENATGLIRLVRILPDGSNHPDAELPDAQGSRIEWAK